MTRFSSPLRLFARPVISLENAIICLLDCRSLNRSLVFCLYKYCGILTLGILVGAEGSRNA